MGKGTWGVKRKCKGSVLCVRVCGHVHVQGRMLWKRFWRCFLPHAYSRVKFLCCCTLYKCTTRRTFVSTDWFFGTWSNYFALLQVTSPLILTYLGTFQLTLGIYGLSCWITASAIALETWTYLPLFCAAIKGPFLSCPVTALTTMQNSKVKPEVIFASQFSYFSSHCCLGESIMVTPPVPPRCLVWDAKRPLSGEVRRATVMKTSELMLSTDLRSLCLTFIFMFLRCFARTSQDLSWCLCFRAYSSHFLKFRASYMLLCKLSQWVITALPYLIYNCYYLMILKVVKLKW